MEKLEMKAAVFWYQGDGFHSVAGFAKNAEIGYWQGHKKSDAYRNGTTVFYQNGNCVNQITLSRE